MQSDIPPLPISCLAEISITRTHPAGGCSFSSKKCCSPPSSRRNVPVNSCNNHHQHRQQQQQQIAGSSPYTKNITVSRVNLHQQQVPGVEGAGSSLKANKRVCSAKMLKIKQLQNQLADAHFHLNELSNENKLLKVIQKRQDAALKKYEGSNAELPRILNTHHEDYRVLEAKFKKLKAQHRDIAESLKDKENELHVLQMQNKKLLQLSKDRNLGEREKLQSQVYDLNHRISQQDDDIQTLKRKLSLETKYLKHQLHVEMVKHKETQKKLQDTETKLANLEALMELREKRSRHAASINHPNSLNALSCNFNKNCRTSVTSQSLINLSDNQPNKLTRAARPNCSYRKRPEASPRTSSFPALGAGSTNQQQQVKKNQHSENNQMIKSSSSLNRASLKDSPIEESLLEEIIDAQKLIDSVSVTASNLTNNSRLLHARLISSAKKNYNKKEDEVFNNGNNLYDRDSVVTVVPAKKSSSTERTEAMKNNVSYNSCSDTESEIEVSMELNTDDDDEDNKQLARKSDLFELQQLEEDKKLGQTGIILDESQSAAKSPRSFDKAKLLAAMKAIDDNENIEFLDTRRRSSPLVDNYNCRTIINHDFDQT